MSQPKNLIHVRDNIFRKPYRRKNGMAANIYYLKTNCGVCGKVYYRMKCNESNGVPCCSKNCKIKMMSVDDGTRKYKRGNGEGHVLIKASTHPNSKKGWYPEHRAIMERSIGRNLKKSEIVHHINMKKDDNRIENLALFGDTKSHFLAHGSINKCVKELIDMNIILFDKRRKIYKVNIRR